MQTLQEYQDEVVDASTQKWVSEYEKEEASSTKTAEERAFEAKDFNSKVIYDLEITKTSLKVTE
jgi:hypothetical protein